MADKKETVLFLCTGNSCRSQMAEGFLRHLAGDRYEALSAGLEPSEVNPLAIQVMAEVGVDISGQKSKHLTEYLGKRKIDHAVFVCAHAEHHCPRIYPFTFDSHSWPLDDPADFEGTDEEKLAKFRETRDRIGAKVREWVAEQSGE